jgi:hypothetical protein
MARLTAPDGVTRHHPFVCKELFCLRDTCIVAVQVLAVDKQKFTMRVGAGVRVTELLPAATKAGMSVQVGRMQQ